MSNPAKLAAAQGAIEQALHKTVSEAQLRKMEHADSLFEAVKTLVQWMDDSDLSHTPSGGHGPLAYEGTEYSVVTDARRALSKAEGRK